MSENEETKEVVSNIHHFHCVCNSLEHQYNIIYDKDDNELYIEIHLSNHGFFRRMKYAFKYLFGYKCKYGCFDEIIIQPEEKQKLINVISMLDESHLPRID